MTPAETRLKEIAAAIEFGSGNGISFREEGAVSLAADIRAVLVTAASAQARIAELEGERDEADRRAGAAERLLADRTDRIAKRERWLRDAKEARGYHQNVSFDRVWADTCAAADRAALQQEG